MSRARAVVPNRLREYRLALGLEQWEVAERVSALTEKGIPLDSHAVSRHERGVYRPQRYYRLLYARVFEVDEAELWPRTGSPQGATWGVGEDPVLVAAWDSGGVVEAAAALSGSGGLVERRRFLFLTGAALTAPAHQWLVHEPGPLQAALRGDRVTPALAGRLTAMIAELRRMDDVETPRVVLSLAERNFGWVSGLLDRASYDEQTGRDLHRALAEFAGIAGYTARDLGEQARAQRYYLTALRASHAADDRMFGAHILKCMAEQAADMGQPRDALMLVDSALAAIRGSATSGQSALLYSWQAYAHAALLDGSACARSISAAQRHSEQIEPDNSPSWLYWLTPADITANAGLAQRQLGRNEHAERLLQRGIAELPAGRHLGEQQIFLTRLAAAQLDNRKLDAATHTGHQALDLADRRSAPRSLDAVRSLCQAMASHQDVPTVREFLDRARDRIA